MKKIMLTIMISVFFFIGFNDKVLASELEEGTYYIETGVNSSMAIDLYGGFTTNGTNIYVSKYSGATNQKWYILALNNGSYSIISSDNGLYVSSINNNANNGTNIGTLSSNETKAQ